jgi:alkaline phosphatase D
VSRRTRREFVRDSAALATGLAVAAHRTATATEPAGTFSSDWHRTPDRVWIGPDYWANPLQDWRIAAGRLECTKAAPDRHLHLLTYSLSADAGSITTCVRVGRLSGDLGGPGSFGFRVGIVGELDDYRNALLFGRGLDAGLTGSGTLFLGEPTADDAVNVPLTLSAVELRFTAEPAGTTYSAAIEVLDPTSGKAIGKVQRSIAAERLVGQIALVANYGTRQPGRRRQPQVAAGTGSGSFWFSDWTAGGAKLGALPQRAFGPIFFSQYTLSRGVLKLTAQMPPLGSNDSQSVRLEIQRGGNWLPTSTADIDPNSRTATFRVEKWEAGGDVPYRLLYALRSTDGSVTQHPWSGTIRRDPVDQDVLTVADVSCNGHMAFPNAEYVDHMARLNPDLLAFTGDQFYESSGGYGVQRGPIEMAILDVLRKWYLHGWTWRELMRDRPSVSIPDDHDVYQGNIWGEGGEPRRGTQEMGGYDMPPEWVNVVHRTQTAHHPDPFDPTPGKHGISVYFGPLVYGGVSFAILADRQFKSGPEGKVPPTGDRGDHVIDPNFDPASADLPGLELLGERQMEFLRDWSHDWRGASMKAVISQTIFTAMATTHGPNREVLRADYDANGWPQSARNEALREIRKSLAFHIAGDQHLPAVVRYGIDVQGDAGAALAGPAVNSVYPRWFEPRPAAIVRANETLPGAGEFIDHFGHPLSVLAVANPKFEFRGSPLEIERDKACGLSLVRFRKKTRNLTIECWPLLVDPQQPGTQFPGWPVTIDPLADSARQAKAWLPTLRISGVSEPLIQLLDDAGDLIYSLRIAGTSFQPHVFAVGEYRVIVLDPESDRIKQLDGLTARATNDEILEVAL